jgi:hypothetical protein
MKISHENPESALSDNLLEEADRILEYESSMQAG